MSRKQSCLLFLVLFYFLLELSGSEAHHIPTDRVFLLKNKATGKCIDPRRPDNEAKLEINPCSTDDTGQLWRMDYYGKLINQASGKCMDVMGDGSRRNGKNLQLYTCEDPDSETDQIWQFNPHNSYFELRNKYTGKCAELWNLPWKSPSTSTSDGTDVQQYTCDVTKSESLWDMVYVAGARIRYSKEAAGYNCGDKNPCSTLVETAGQYHWPHENHNQYVLCIPGIRCFEMFCGDGLEWNQDLKTCN